MCCILLSKFDRFMLMATIVDKSDHMLISGLSCSLQKHQSTKIPVQSSTSMLSLMKTPRHVQPWLDILQQVQKQLRRAGICSPRLCARERTIKASRSMT